MAFHPQFQPLSFEQANPIIMGLMQGQKFAQNMQQFPLEMEEKRIRNEVLPTSLRAEAASKLAYANLMGPQFLAKLMSNPDILANMPESDLKESLSKVIGAGKGQGTGQGFLNPYIQKTLESQSQQQNQGNQGQTVNYKGTPIVDHPEEGRMQGGNQLNNDAYDIQGYYNPASTEYEPEKTFAEKAALYKGIQEEGKATGKARSEDIQDFGRQYDAGLRLNDKFERLTSLIHNPTFQQMRANIPFFQDKQLHLLSKIGSPEQKEMIGELQNTAEEVVRDTINSFTGRILKGELDISRNMKISPNDTFDVIVGKLRSASIYKDLNMRRIQIASDLMQNKHMSKKDALEQANKMTNAQDIINNVNKKLDYQVTVRNKNTGEIMTLPVSEARKRGIPNV
jgi:hypothetical protein